MLDPHDRNLLLESLRPPEGFTLDRAIGTTFSLDLVALLTAPLAFTFFEWEDENGRPTVDPTALLEAVRRYASRIALFCQAGQIHVPRRNQLLYGYLEESVIEVTPPGGKGVFHPKVWILRFTASDEPVRYRLLCLTRNLTFDRAWDTILVLDGPLIDRQKAIAVNHPLADFVAALPGLALRPVAEPLRAEITRIQDELRRVDWELPEGFDGIHFWPLGIEDHRKWPFRGRVDRMLVVSPFLTDGCLERLSEEGEGHVLVSRLESLQAANPKVLKAFNRIYALNPAADAEDSDMGAEDALTRPLQGLHAKIYAADAGWDSSLWIGSANATAAAYDGNVEFLVELIGKKSRCGISAVLGEDEKRGGFRSLLQEFTPGKDAVPEDAEQQKLEKAVETAGTALICLKLTAKVSPVEGPETFRISLNPAGESRLNLPAGVRGRCWPITLPDTAAMALTTGAAPVAEFGPVSFDTLTSFFAFELTIARGEKKAANRFVLNLPLLGAPEGRRERLLRSILGNREQVLRFILFLLSDSGTAVPGTLLGTAEPAGAGGNGSWMTGELPLFETLLKALDRDPGKLDHVHRLVEDLRGTPEGRTLLPEGFESVWDPIWAARKELTP